MVIKKNLDQGLFITFEGGEGSGKSSLLEAAFNSLVSSGHESIKTRAPGGTSLGKKIREILLHTKDLELSHRAEMLLFLSDRAQHVDEIIKPALRQNKIVLCDRFSDSTLAYQGASRSSLKYDDVEEMILFSTDGLKPDLTFFLDVDPKLGLTRAKKAIETDGKASYDRLEQEALEFHTQVREAYLKIAENEPKRVVTLDASKSKEVVFSEALEILEKRFGLICT